MNTIAIITPAGQLVRASYDGDSLLSVLQAECGGYVQAIDMTSTMTMWCNEDGKFNGSEWNECATAIWHALFGPTDTIFGTVVYTGGADENGDTQGLSEDDYMRLKHVADAYMAAAVAGYAGS